MAIARSTPILSSTSLTLERPAPESLVVRLAGPWRVGEAIPSVARVRRELDEQRPRHLAFDASGLDAWDTALVSFALRVDAMATAAGVAGDRSGLPTGVERLIGLAKAGRTSSPARPPPRASRLARIGNWALDACDGLLSALRWIGDVTLALVGMLLGRRALRRGDLLRHAHDAGLRSLVPVMFVVGVVGIVFAHVALHELKKIGDSAAVARVIARSMVRELAPLMTAIVVAVRTGAGYATELDSMRRSHERDAFTALGMSPVEALALPRILAVMLMVPLLCVFAIAAGLLSGATVGIDVAHIPSAEYLAKTLAAVSDHDLANAFVRSTVYGLVIGLTACHIGLNARRRGCHPGDAASSGASQCVLAVVLARGLIMVMT